MSGPELFLAAASLYLGLGAVFSLAFLTLGVQRLDHAANGAWAFRLLILPGCVALWPLLALRWARSRP